MKFFTVATGKVLKETKSYDKMIEKRNNRKEYKRKLFPCADCQEGGLCFGAETIFTGRGFFGAEKRVARNGS